MRFPLLCLLAIALLIGSAHAAEPFFKKNDVIALVGGEDMVVASEYGYLELLLVRALPEYHLRFRNLAWEGDTVFEQRRDLNFPSWEEALDKIGATVVICQFGQMESLAGKEKLPEFIAAYEKLIERLSGDGKRRIAVITPMIFDPMIGEKLPDFVSGKPVHPLLIPAAEPRNSVLGAYVSSIANLADRNHFRCTDWFGAQSDVHADLVRTRDGIHVSDRFQWMYGVLLAERLIGNATEDQRKIIWAGATDGAEKIRNLIVAKNKLWFNYWRVQNWAFLAGDRTNQPSSRDHGDPSKRWFPAEREEFLPLMEAKEKEIDALAQKLAPAMKMTLFPATRRKRSPPGSALVPSAGFGVSPKRTSSGLRHADNRPRRN